MPKVLEKHQVITNIPDSNRHTKMELFVLYFYAEFQCLLNKVTGIEDFKKLVFTI